MMEKITKIVFMWSVTILCGMTGVCAYAGPEITPSTEPQIAPPRAEAQITPPAAESQITPPRAEAQIAPPTTEPQITPPRAEAQITPPATEPQITPPAAEPQIAPASEPVKLFVRGVDVSTRQGAFDKAIAGKWAVYIPNMAWSDRKEYGNTVVDTTHVAQGASFGTLLISKDGNYQWKNANKVISKGKLVQVIPRSDAVAGETYWGIVKDAFGHQHYISYDSDGGIYLSGVNTHLYSYSLQRTQ